MKWSMVKTDSNSWQPVGDSDYEKSGKFAVGDIELFSVVKVRSPRFHRKYFGLIRILFDNQEKYNNLDTFRKITEMRAGWYDVVADKNGNNYYLPKSISYENMTGEEFEGLYNAVLDQAVEDGQDRPGLLQEVEMFL